MRTPPTTTLARALRMFFTSYLPQVRGASPHTARSYRDSLALLLRFVATRGGHDVAQLDLDTVTPEVVIAFLHDIEHTRRNRASTRNVRLAAIHAFFRYVAHAYPEQMEPCQQMLAIPFKRSRPRMIEYLDYDEILAVLDSIDRSTADGRRDYVLLATMFNTGARVQEILDGRPCDLQLVTPCHVRLIGKGRKERLCPLWPQTAQILHAYMTQRRLTPLSSDRLFVNHRGTPLTRFGVRYLLAKYCDRARPTCPTLGPQAIASSQLAAQHGGALAEGGRRPHHHQPLVGPRESQHDAPVCGDRPRGEARGPEQGPITRSRRRGAGRLAHRHDHPRLARCALNTR